MFPSWKMVMLPILKVSQDGVARRRQDFEQPVSDLLLLSPEQREERVASGVSKKIYDRIQWAIYYMVKAGFLAQVERGLCEITDRGRAVIIEKPEGIDLNYLKTIPEFAEYYKGLSKPKDDASESEGPVEVSESTPIEQIDRAVATLRARLADDLLTKIKAKTPRFFEELVVRLVQKMYKLPEDLSAVRGKPGDGGIDGLIQIDRLGLDLVYIQAKKWDGGIPDSDIRDFLGALTRQHAQKGVFITTSHFQANAHDSVKNLQMKIKLIAGKELAELCIEYGVGVSPMENATFTLMQIDNNFFEDET